MHPFEFSAVGGNYLYGCVLTKYFRQYFKDKLPAVTDNLLTPPKPIKLNIFPVCYVMSGIQVTNVSRKSKGSLYVAQRTNPPLRRMGTGNVRLLTLKPTVQP